MNPIHFLTIPAAVAVTVLCCGGGLRLALAFAVLTPVIMALTITVTRR